MRYLPLISCFFLFSGCGRLYSNLKKTKIDQACLQKFAPVYSSLLFTAGIEVSGKHLSGLLVIKKMPDSSVRLVFSSQSGPGLFDFGFSGTGDFKVYQIISQLDKKPVIKTLRKDFELVLMLGLSYDRAYGLEDDSLHYFAFPREIGFYYYITDSSCTRLVRMQRASKRKVVVEAIIQNGLSGMPDSIGISHKNFHFDIGLKRIGRETEENRDGSRDHD